MRGYGARRVGGRVERHDDKLDVKVHERKEIVLEKEDEEDEEDEEAALQEAVRGPCIRHLLSPMAARAAVMTAGVFRSGCTCMRASVRCLPSTASAESRGSDSTVQFLWNALRSLTQYATFSITWHSGLHTAPSGGVDGYPFGPKCVASLPLDVGWRALSNALLLYHQKYTK